MSDFGYLTNPTHDPNWRSDWQTPPDIKRLIAKTLGPIYLDPATAPGNPMFALRFYSRQRPDPTVSKLVRTVYQGSEGTWLGPCGLSGEWPEEGLTYVNSPWGPHMSGKVDPTYQIKRKGRLIGVGRGWAARIAQHRGETLVCCSGRIDAQWFRTLHEWCDWRLDWQSKELGSRVQYIQASTGKPAGGNNSPTTFFYRGPRWRAFCDGWGPHGLLVPGERIVRTIAGAVNG